MIIQNIELVIDKLVQSVVENKISASIDIEPDRAEISITPWEPYRPIYQCGRNDDE